MPVETLTHPAPQECKVDVTATNQFGNRILPSTEPQEPVKQLVSTIVFNAVSDKHLEKVEERQRAFDLALGIKREDKKTLSYNPILDRANVELAQTSGQVQGVKTDIERELTTNLRERYHTSQSAVKYILDDNGRAFSQDDNNEPVDIKFQRGALYRIKQGSPEPAREQETVLAGAKAKMKLARPETVLGSKVIVVSPPGVVEGTIYKDNFVDIYEVKIDPQTGKKFILMTRFASSSDNKDYKEIITRLKPDCSSATESVFDVWCLSNPIFIDSRSDTREAHEIFSQEFKHQEKVTKEEDFQEILQKSFSVRQNYIDVICGKLFNPREIAIAFNAVLNKADAIREEIMYRGRRTVSGIRGFVAKVVSTFKNIKEEVEWWGRKAVKEVMAGCGSSGGFSLGSGIKGLGEGVLSKISSVFTGKDQYGSLEFECPKCGKVNRRPKGKLIPNCQHCSADVRC